MPIAIPPPPQHEMHMAKHTHWRASANERRRVSRLNDSVLVAAHWLAVRAPAVVNHPQRTQTTSAKKPPRVMATIAPASTFRPLLDGGEKGE